MPTKEFQDYLHQSQRVNATISLLESFLLNIDPILNNIDIIENDQYKKALLESWQFFERKVPWEEHFQMIAEIYIARDVDTFLTYLSRILLRIFTERPLAFKSFFDETGKRNETDKKVGMRDILDYLLQYNNTTEVIKQLAQDQVDMLGFKGLDSIISDLNSRLKLGFDKSMPAYKSSCQLIEIRNIITHNSCYVSKIFLKRTQRTDLKVGEKLPLSFQLVNEDLKKFKEFTTKLDETFISHFKLTTDANSEQEGSANE